jgi:hypothetical protein
MFLVGGFAESPLLQEEIRNQFNTSLKVVIPQARIHFINVNNTFTLMVIWIKRNYLFSYLKKDLQDFFGVSNKQILAIL